MESCASIWRWLGLSGGNAPSCASRSPLKEEIRAAASFLLWARGGNLGQPAVPRLSPGLPKADVHNNRYQLLTSAPS